jgi:hypothetical protein
MRFEITKYEQLYFLNQNKMENQNISKQDCGCSDGSCCAPQKKNSTWKIWIFIAIILAAAAIATVKIVQVKSAKDKPVP